MDTNFGIGRKKSGEYIHTRRAYNPGEPESSGDAGKPARRAKALPYVRDGGEPFPLPKWASPPPATFKAKRDQFMAENPEFEDGSQWADGDWTSADWSNVI